MGAITVKNGVVQILYLLGLPHVSILTIQKQSEDNNHEYQYRRTVK